jgi:hypothetical protein
MITPSEGADRILDLATSPDVEGATEGYYEKDRLVQPSPVARDQALTARLWDESMRLAGSHSRTQTLAHLWRVTAIMHTLWRDVRYGIRGDPESSRICVYGNPDASTGNGATTTIFASIRDISPLMPPIAFALCHELRAA